MSRLVRATTRRSRSLMPNTMSHVGLDVHAETIAVAVAEADGSVRELGMIRNRPEAVRKLIAKLGAAASFRRHKVPSNSCDGFVPSGIPTANRRQRDEGCSEEQRGESNLDHEGVLRCRVACAYDVATNHSRRRV